MADNTSRSSERRTDIETDGGVETDGGTVDYLDARVNIFKPSTPFMRDHLKIVWTMFAAWVLIVFGPVTATYLAPDLMTSITVLGFPLHYLLTATGAPLGALVLSFIYARKRDQLDEKYGIDHSTPKTTSDSGAVASDGGSEQ
ncbi:DUF4212 domain-containing protein [Halorussus halophilus]|uniref:DUF4212 domain-containing protein n=1 Tax=Halorussus halophilus TaxID=2650975 RepID=UPI001300D643|nr:DUF4212 domain-containing protein [Halorussus halophilus]